jgi:hypothetical protein
MLGDVGGEGAALFFVPVERPLALGEERFNNREHAKTIRLRRIVVHADGMTPNV